MLVAYTLVSSQTVGNLTTQQFNVDNEFHNTIIIITAIGTIVEHRNS